MERKALFQRLDEITHCPKDIKVQFCHIFQPLQLEKGQLLASPAQAGPSIYFTATGLLHHYQKISLADGKYDLQTQQFHLAGNFFQFSLPQMQQPTTDYISALAQSRLLVTSYPKIQQLIRQHPQGIQILLSIQEQLIESSLRQLSLLHTQPALARYQKATVQLGMYVYQIPQQSLASYLCISRKHLGRLHQQVLRKK